MLKQDRPYGCVQITINNLTFAIPFRHHIGHKHAFFTVGDAGLDYSKSVVIEYPSDIGQGHPQIKQTEYNLIKGKDTVIQNGLTRYIRLYKKAKQHQHNPHYRNIIKCSSLQYFEKYLTQI